MSVLESLIATERRAWWRLKDQRGTVGSKELLGRAGRNEAGSAPVQVSLGMFDRSTHGL